MAWMNLNYLFLGAVCGIVLRDEVASRRARARASNETTITASDFGSVGGTIIVKGGPKEGRYEVLRRLWFGRLKVRKVA